MEIDRKSLLKDLVGALVEFLPYGTAAKKLMQIPINHGVAGWLFPATARPAASIENVAQAVADSIASIPLASLDNPGSAASAAYDIVEIIGRAKVSPQTLINCELDPGVMSNHILAHGKDILATASSERTGFITQGVNEFSHGLIAVAPQLPGVQTAFMRAVLKGTTSTVKDESHAKSH